MPQHEGHQEYPKALRPPDFDPKPALVKQADGTHVEDQQAGRHAQVIVHDEEEEKAVLAEWKKPKTPIPTTPPPPANKDSLTK